MKVNVLVGVDVIERQTGCAERFELRPDLHRELLANLRNNSKPDAGASHVPIEFTLLADELRDLDLRQNGMTVDEVKVQANAKLG
jgi:hypothetical protein